MNTKNIIISMANYTKTATVESDVADYIAELKAELQKANNNLADLETVYTDTLEQRDALRTALDKYGWHIGGCQNDTNPICTCGFDAAKGGG